MTSNKELQLAFRLAIILLVIGVLSFAAFPAKAPEQPVRLMFKSAAGKVMFTHKTHFGDEGYGVACMDCHHHPEDGSETAGCGYCHLAEPGETLPESCLDCHEADEIEGTEPPKRSDAFHQQCIGCHKDNDAGPQECAECHMM